jgi:hypothetical protein
LPAVFAADFPEADEAEPAPSPAFDGIPLRDLAPRPQEAPPGAPSAPDEPSFPRGVGGPEVQAWREQEELRQLRQWTGDAIFGVPLLVPQLLLEEFLPRGIAVGPTTFLYKTDSTSSSFSLVVFDQVLFHGAEFLAQTQSYASDGGYDLNLQHGQRRVLRRSLMGGFRASYALPRLSMDQVLQVAGEHGVVGYAAAPPVLAALLYAKGLDQKVSIDDDVRVRFKLASGKHLVRSLHSDDTPFLSLELKLFDLPVGLLASFDLSEHGVTPAFVGIGTTLDVVEELISRQTGELRPD